MLQILTQVYIHFIYEIKANISDKINICRQNKNKKAI